MSRGTVLRRSVPPLFQRIPPQGAVLPDWLSPISGGGRAGNAAHAARQRSSAVARKISWDAKSPFDKTRLRCVVACHIHELIEVVLGDECHRAAKPNKLGVAEARLKAIKADILENLSSPELTETVVALRQRLTSRYIRMLFQAEGTTFSKFVLIHRLIGRASHAFRSSFCQYEDHDIALAVGFNDLSYFDRTFRRQFYATPSQVRAILVSGHHRVVSEGRSLSA